MSVSVENMQASASKVNTHIAEVGRVLFHVMSPLQDRALSHDTSKFEADELEGYARFEAIPKGLAYGSPEYEEAKAAAMKDNNAVQLHYMRNDHHPEYWVGNAETDGVDLSCMSLFAIIEMVADWCGAHLCYGNAGDWRESVEHNITKYAFTGAQKWVIRELAGYLTAYVNTHSVRKVG